MAGLSGKTAWLGIIRQTAKGTTPANPRWRIPFAGGNIAPVRETDRLGETDAARDQGAAYVTTAGVEGSPEVYVRSLYIPQLLNGVLGDLTTAPGGPPYVHTIVPQDGNLLPWFSFFKNVGGANGVYEVYRDCQIGSLTISAEAGGPLTAAMGIQGLNATLLDATADAATMAAWDAIALQQGTVFNFNNAAVYLGGTQAVPTNRRTIRSFECTIENNLARQQTDDLIPYDIAVGQREVTLGFDMIFENITEYRRHVYGSSSATVQGTTLYETYAKFEFQIDASNILSLEFPNIVYEEFPVDPDPGGDPIVVSVRAVSQRSGSLKPINATVTNTFSFGYAT